MGGTRLSRPIFASIRELREREVLEDAARTIVVDLGYEKPKPGYSACGFDYDEDYLEHLREHDAPSRWDDASVYFWYRLSPEILTPVDLSYRARPFRVSSDDPPPLVGGMVGIRLDPQGNLLDLRAVPRQGEEVSGEPIEFDWSTLFERAGLDFARFEPAPPSSLPPSYADQRSAWEGLHAESAMRIRVEAASYRGRTCRPEGGQASRRARKLDLRTLRGWGQFLTIDIRSVVDG